MPDRPEFFGLSAAPITAAVVGAFAGWVRDSGTATTRLFASTDQVGVGTATAVAGCKLTVEDTDAATNTNTDLLTLTHRTTGIPVAGFSTGILFRGETSSDTVEELARISADAAGVTPGSEKAGLDFWVRTGGAALSKKWALTGSGNWVIYADATYSIADKTNRLASVYSNEFRCYLASADANPSADLATNGLFLGAGGATTLDTKFARTSAATVTLDNAIGGDATLIVRTLGTTAARSDTVTRGANRAGRLVTAAGADALLATDDAVGYNATAGNQTPTLPSLAANRGMTVTVLRVPGDVSVNTCIITPNGADTIWGAATKPMLAGTSVTLFAAPSGTEWWIL